MSIQRIILFPFAFCYGIIMFFRNFLFNIGVIPSKRFNIPVISVGNLSCGGTGKTPHVEYLIRLLSQNYFIATLSRGYGRKSDGFLIGSKRSNVKYLGDEPLQYAKKFDKIKVAVDEKRKRGIGLLMEKYPGLDLILLDDAFQHRHVKPGLNILLTDSDHLYSEDYLLPVGKLRESKREAKRADVIIVTKTPKIFSPITRRRILEDIHPRRDQVVLFSYVHYGNPVPGYEPIASSFPSHLTNILLISGIASDFPFREYLMRMCSELIPMKFPNHHFYTQKDIENINQRFVDLPTKKKVIITTEKDMMRLKTPELSTILKNLPLFYIPIEIRFHGEDMKKFDDLILTYVEKNKRDH